MCRHTAQSANSTTSAKGHTCAETASPDLVKPTQVKKGDYRIHVPGFNKRPGSLCDHVTGQISFVKAHIDSRHRVEVYGRVGH